MIVIGLSAKMGCGKTTLCKMLMDMAPFEVAVRMAFGDLIKRECSAHFGFPVEWCYSQEGKEKVVRGQWEMSDGSVVPGPQTVRELLQWYGTDYRRAQDPDYWIKAMQKRIDAYKNTVEFERTLIVVDDVRFPDEAQVCLDNGYCFRLEPFPGWQPGPHADHASETALDGYDKFTEVFYPGHGMVELAQVAHRIGMRVWG